MSICEKYANLYIRQYVDYIFSNLEKNRRFFRNHCTVVKEPLLEEFYSYIKIFFKIFGVGITKESMLKMRNYTTLTRNDNLQQEKNIYELYLDNAKITVEGYEDYFYLMFTVGDLIIRGKFNILNYINDQNFSIIWESVNLHSDDCYTTIVGNQVFSYSRGKYNDAVSTGQNLPTAFYPDHIYKLSLNARQGYFELMKDIYDESIGIELVVKRKMLY